MIATEHPLGDILAGKAIVKQFRLTLKNYRAFTDSLPLRIEIQPGFTALVGRNNSGKSTIKLFFYELRVLFAQISSSLDSTPSLATAFYERGEIGANYPGLADPLEIFNNTNDRPMSIEIELTHPTSEHSVGNSLHRLVATCKRSQPNAWRLEVYDRNNARVVTHLQVRFEGKTAILADGQTFDCSDLLTCIETLRDARYYGPFRNALNQGAGDHFDLRIGTAFIDLWRQWKTGGIKAQSRAIAQVTEEIRRLFEFNRIEINASDSLKTLIVSIEDQPYRLSELGSGLTQFIMALGNAATARPSILLIDEPETNLHPSLQIDFLLSLGHYAQEAVIFSTHSVGLARSVADRIYSVQKREAGTIVQPFESLTNYLEFIGELSFSTFKEMGSDTLLLVEGVSDVKTVQQLLRLYGKEHKVVILPLGGSQLACGGREAELSEIARLSNNLYALVDSERPAEGALPDDKRARFAETCEKLGINVCITERRAIENYFTADAVGRALGPAHSALGHFQLLKEADNAWNKNDNWKIARQMELRDIRDTDIGEFLGRL